jgi:predicted adenine nucleotide alpha hydrolase (AANH) superfamily ATPase
MLEDGYIPTVLYYNPNIHPWEEYEKRKEENKRFASKKGVKFIDLDYDLDSWYSRIHGLEKEPERGKRCSACFSLRFERTALYAYEHGFQLFTTSLSISRWKNSDQINSSAFLATEKFEGVTYWAVNWRKDGILNRRKEIIQKEEMYQQKYCGCIYSMKTTEGSS